MKKTGLLLIGLTMAVLSNGQTIRFQGGTSFSKLDWELKEINDDSFFNEILIGYSFFTGLDYMDKQYYNLSSNIGMIRKGGKGEVELTNINGDLIGETVTEKPTLDYFSINTTFNLKYRIKEAVSPFISFGPRLDYLVSSSKIFDDLKDIDELNYLAIGMILGGGLKYDYSNLQFGFRADYYVDFTNVADWKIEETGIEGEVNVSTFTINLTIGYKL
ncbi:MAG: hypothetical protein IH598_05170 [Bacteroidales bacterium]|nr:hypothetical protein [Bacteroidales bacterium]